ncbi:MAG: uroporphyrinogen-III synthase [Caulobacteraceae bacterium]|nr:uroporphyrinogen-III synthase [Caulobacteraceae bacterium]
MTRVWITRAQPGADATAARVRELGLRPLVEPLLEVRLLPSEPVDLAAIGALAFTSANAVRAFAPRSPRCDLPVFVIGAATAAAARAAGFNDVRSADGDVRALGEFVASQWSPTDGAILHPGAAEPAGDLVGALASAGLSARGLTMYETVARPPSAALLATLPDVRFVLVHSPKGARALAEVLERSPAPHISALCLSRAVAAPLADAELAGMVFAEAPSEDALMEILQASARRR